MIGDAIDGPGGISAVARTYRDSGMMAAINAQYVSNYDGAGLMRQLRCMARAIRDTARAVRNDNAKLLHVHSASRGGFWRAFLLCEFARRSHIPFVLHIHSGEFIDFYELECGRLRKAAIRRTLRNAARVVCLTAGWRNRIAAIEPNAKYAVLPNPVVPPEPESADVRDEGVMLLYLGRLTEKKGLFDLLDALVILRQRGVEARLAVGGVGDDGALRERMAEMGISDLVTICGWVESQAKDALLRKASVLVAPSHFEAFGVSIVEAMMYGKPVIATRVGGIPEVIEDRVHGLLVPPCKPQALADAISLLANSHELRRSLGEAGKRHAYSKFTPPRVINEINRMYDEIFTDYLPVNQAVGK